MRFRGASWAPAQPNLRGRRSPDAAPRPATRRQSCDDSGMPTPNGRAAIPILILGGLVAAGVGAVAIVERILDARRDHGPAAPGTPQVGARLPIGLWPSDGSEPMVGRGPAGWREWSRRCITATPSSMRRRALGPWRSPPFRDGAGCSTRDRTRSLVLRGSYDPALIAAAWLHPLTSGTRLADLASFGIGSTALDTVRAAARLDADPELEATWRREFGIDVVRPEITAAIIGETDSDRLGMLWALLLGLAGERVAIRQAV